MSFLSAPKLSAAVLGSVLAIGAVFCVATAPQAQSLDLDAIFNCSADGPLGTQTPEQCLQSRGILLNTCTACHTFVPIVKAQKTAAGWDATLGVHRSRVPDLTNEQFQALGEFLKAHFNDTVPVPVLPPELEALGSGLPA